MDITRSIAENEKREEKKLEEEVEKLGELRGLYKNASMDLKRQPAFLRCLQTIAGEIGWSKQCFKPNCEITNNGTDIEINISYSIFNSETPVTDENFSRNVTQFKISLDEEGDITLDRNDAHYVPQRRNEEILGTKCSYSYDRSKYKNGTEMIIARQRVTSPLLSEKLDYEPRWAPSVHKQERCDIYDHEIIKQLSYQHPIFYEGGAIDLRESSHKGYTAWSAVRDKDDPSKAIIEEYVQYGYKSSERITTKRYFDASINMSSPNAMRIDQPYSLTSYTESQIDKIYNLKISKNAASQQEFQELLRNPDVFEESHKSR